MQGWKYVTTVELMKLSAMDGTYPAELSSSMWEEVCQPVQAHHIPMSPAPISGSIMWSSGHKRVLHPMNWQDACATYQALSGYGDLMTGLFLLGSL